MCEPINNFILSRLKEKSAACVYVVPAENYADSPIVVLLCFVILYNRFCGQYSSFNTDYESQMEISEVVGGDMEHRIGDRKKSDINVELYLSGNRIGVFPISNIGFSGFGVSNCHGCLRADMFLQAIANCEGEMEIFSGMSALVIWAKDDRAGLMWASDRGRETEYINTSGVYAA